MLNYNIYVECIFCKIVSGELASNVVYDDDSVIVFEDIAPKAPIHYLIIPKTHYSNVAELADKNSEVLAHLTKVSRKVVTGDYQFIFNTGEDAGQTVFHVHGHILSGFDSNNSPLL